MLALREASEHNARKCREKRLKDMNGKAKLSLLDSAATCSTETNAYESEHFCLFPRVNSVFTFPERTAEMLFEPRMYALASKATLNLEPDLHEIL